jgi:hypothetical protein
MELSVQSVVEGRVLMAWKIYLAFAFAIAVSFVVMLAATSHQDAMLVKSDRLNVTPDPSGFNMERFAG